MKDRRSFLRDGTGAVLTAGGVSNLNSAALGANEKINLALIGGRGRGRAVALGAIKAGAYIKTFCDLDETVLAKTGAAIAEAQAASTT